MSEIPSNAVQIALKAPNVRRRVSGARVAIYIVLGLLAVVYVAPMLTVVNVALKTQQSFNLNPTAVVTQPQFKNFVSAWVRANFPLYMGNTIFYTVVATAIYVLTAVFVAFPISRAYVKGSRFVFTLFVIALFLPYALIPQFQLILHLRLYNTRTGYIMLFLVDPIGIVILVNYISSVPRAIDEAAAMDGCGYVRFVLQIVFPLIKPALASVIVLHAIAIWNEYVAPLIYLPGKHLLPITRGLMVFYGQYGNEWTVLAAAMLMLMVPMVVLFLILQRWIIAGVVGGAVKS